MYEAIRMHTETERCLRAVQSKDARFDGWFFTAVRTTGIYCRPSCPVVAPKPENMEMLIGLTGTRIFSPFIESAF